MKTILLSGSCGMIGSNFVRRLTHEKSNYKIIGIDKLSYPECRSNIYYNNYHKCYIGNICDQHFVNNIFKMEKPDYIINLAAESHVDLSIESALPFVQANVVGTQVLIDACSKFGIEKFVYISSDEIYGQLNGDQELWIEQSIPAPRNPYAASKLAGELMVVSAGITHNLPFNITRSCNNFGPRQRPINFIPKIIKNFLNKEKIPVYGDGLQSRSWMYVDNHVDGIMTVLESGIPGEVYNVDMQAELSNIELVQKISRIMSGDMDLVSFAPDRKAHDKRYGCNSDKLRGIGWKPEFKFKDSLENTVNWYLANPWFFNIKE